MIMSLDRTAYIVSKRVVSNIMTSPLILDSRLNILLVSSEI